MSLGEAAKATVEGFRGSPALLLIAVINVVMLGGMLYVAKAQSEERREMRGQDDAMIKVLTQFCAQRQ